MDFKKGAIIAISVVGLIFVYILSDKLVYNVDAGEYVVAQSFISGDLSCWTEPGYKARWFSKVNSFRRSSPVNFGVNPPIDIFFNDNGSAKVKGSAQVYIEPNCQKLIELRKNYVNQNGVDDALVFRTLKKAIYNTGPLLSSSESASSKKSQLLTWIEDQGNNGIYATRITRAGVKQTHLVDGKEVPVSDNDFRAIESEIVLGTDGKPSRNEESELERYGVTIGNVTIDGMAYDDATQKSIDNQRNSQQSIQAARAAAQSSYQAEITARADGLAKAAASEANQRVLMATAVTAAEQEKKVALFKAEQDKEVAVTAAKKEKEVSELKLASAQNYKAEQILRGEGDAAYKRLLMDADGALQPRLDAYTKSIIGVAQAFSNQETVPKIVVGGNGTTTNSIDAFMSLSAVKMAKDLGLDPGSLNVKKP